MQMESSLLQKTLLQLNIESKPFQITLWDSQILRALTEGITGLPNISITCSCSVTSVSGEKASIFKEDFMLKAL